MLILQVRKSVIGATIVLASIVANAGDVRPLPGYCPPREGCYAFDGIIQRSDLNNLGALLTKAATTKQQVMVKLNSEGGDFNVAIVLGRMMRNANAIASGGVGDVCLSSCVMLLAGATFRAHYGKVGIHRPYRMSNEPITAEAMKQEFNSWSKSAKDFLSEVNVDTRLWDSMIRISPENVKILTASELSDFGLKGQDPISAELEDSREAKHYGVSKTEYLRRKGAVFARCNPILQSGNFDGWRTCSEFIKATGQ